VVLHTYLLSRQAGILPPEPHPQQENSVYFRAHMLLLKRNLAIYNSLPKILGSDLSNQRVLYCRILWVEFVSGLRVAWFLFPFALVYLDILKQV
jgi:hypothetical protein